MEINVSGRHVEVTPAIKTYATDKVGKLPRYFDRVHSISVVIDRADSHSFVAEVIVVAEHHDNFVSKVTGSDMYACIDSAVDKLERQLTDFKEKTRAKKGRTPMAG